MELDGFMRILMWTFNKPRS